MNCDTCGTALTEFNATNYRHVHDVGNCAQVLLAQRDNARAALESDRAKLAEAQQTIADFERQGVLLNEEGLKLDAERAADRALLRRIVEAHYNGTGIGEIIDKARARIGEGK